METTETTTKLFTRHDVAQQVTDTIIKQLEAGTVPWQKPWKGNNHSSFSIPQNVTTGNHYKGVNILLLWSSAITNDFPVQEWATFKQWQENKEVVRKGEKGSLIVYYDTIEKEIDGELKKIPFLKSSVVFNRSQLASFEYTGFQVNPNTVPLVERIERVDAFINNTGAIIEHKENRACYIPSVDKINMPLPEAFIDTDNCTATEGYYGTLLHEVVHWTGAKTRLDRINSKKFADDNYATEELVAELGSAFLSCEFDINPKAPITNHASYIASWLKALKDNKNCIITAASAASKATGYLHSLQPTP